MQILVASLVTAALQAPSLDVVEIARTGGRPAAPFGTIGSMLEVGRGTSRKVSCSRWALPCE